MNRNEFFSIYPWLSFSNFRSASYLVKFCRGILDKFPLASISRRIVANPEKTRPRFFFRKLRFDKFVALF